MNEAELLKEMWKTLYKLNDLMGDLHKLDYNFDIKLIDMYHLMGERLPRKMIELYVYKEIKQ